MTIARQFFILSALSNIIFGVVADKITYNNDAASFTIWTERFGKVYNEQEKQDRFAIWQKNYEHVESINSEKLSWKATIDNQFADLTTEEFSKTILLPKFNPQTHKKKLLNKSKLRNPWNNLSLKDKITSPTNTTSFDWRDHGAVTEVQDQGSVGTCWAFSTIGTIEGQWFLGTAELVDLSEEYLVDCDGSADWDENHADCSVFGGWPYLALQFGIERGGVPTEEKYPYCSGTGDCYPCMLGPVPLCGLPPSYCDDSITDGCPEVVPYASYSDWSNISTDEEEIKEDLMEIGPLSALLDATQLQFYDSGVWVGHVEGSPPFLGCSKTYLDHAVLLVGFGVDEETGLDYWVVKNSWGGRFGEDGYFRILRGDGTCGINTAVTTAIY